MERAQRFTTPGEARSARSALRTDRIVHKNQFETLVAETLFAPADWVECQLLKKGAMCRTKHGHGWVAKFKDGTEAFIGGVCARKHFIGVESFAREARRVSLELQIDDLVERIRRRINDAAFEARLDTASERHRVLRQDVGRLRAAWPAPMLQRLAGMTKTGNASIMLSVCYLEKEEDRSGKLREVPRWRSHRWRTLDAPAALELGALRDVYEHLSAAREAMREGEPHREQRVRELKARAERLESFDATEAKLSESERLVTAFKRPGNLKRLPWLVFQDEARAAIVRGVLEFSSGRKVSDLEVQSTLRQWHAEIRAEFDGRDFRVE